MLSEITNFPLGEWLKQEPRSSDSNPILFVLPHKLLQSLPAPHTEQLPLGREGAHWSSTNCMSDNREKRVLSCKMTN